MSSLSGAITGNSAPSLVLKADEEFLAAVSAHANALSRLQALARTGDRVDGGATATIGAMTALGKAMLGLAEHERKNAGVVTTTATAVATAAASFARSGAAFAAPAPASLAAPAASSGASSADAAAAAAFSAHTAAAAASRSDTIAGMFAAADFSDPYSSLAAVAATSTAASGSSSSAGASKRLETSADMLIAAGQCLLDQSTMLRDQHKGYESTMLAALRSERDKEAELAEALRRREGTIERAQEANTTLLRKKKTLLGLRHVRGGGGVVGSSMQRKVHDTAPLSFQTDKDYTAKITLAQQAVDKAETALTARKEVRGSGWHLWRSCALTPPFPFPFRSLTRLLRSSKQSSRASCAHAAWSSWRGSQSMPRTRPPLRARALSPTARLPWRWQGTWGPRRAVCAAATHPLPHPPLTARAEALSWSAAARR